MKLTLPAPVTITLADVQFTYSLGDMVRHFVRHGREFGRTAEDARAAKRILDAFEKPKGNEVELLDSDIKMLKAMAEKPSCGWAAHVVTRSERVGGTDEAPIVRAMKRRGQAPAMDYLPLIDALTSAG